MMRILSEIVVALSASPAISLLAKGTVVLALGLVGVWLARNGRAALRHALLASAFSVLLALPVVSFLATPVKVAMPVTAGDSMVLPLFDSLVGAPASGASTAARVNAAAPRQGWPKFSLSTILLYVWFIGAASFLLPLTRGVLQVHSLRRYGLPWRHGQALAEELLPGARRVEVLLHELLPGPMTCGVLHPAIILPADAQNWDGKDLERALVHEVEHVRRYDWMVHCFARIGCAVYWFHPLVWTAWRRLALEAERSCDDAVLRNSDATAYADQLVGLARKRKLSGVEKSPALAMANRSDLAARIRALLDVRQRRGPVGALLLAATCVAAAAIVLTISPLRMVAAPQSTAAASAQDIPKWDAISIKRCDVPPGTSVEGRGVGSNQSPDRWTWYCRPIMSVIAMNYTGSATGVDAAKLFSTKFEGFPAWVNSDRFTIEAKAQGKVSPGMIKTLLEDRFQLKVHEETREGRVYVLSVAKGGPKMEALQPGTCEPFDLASTQRSTNPCPMNNKLQGEVNMSWDSWVTMDSFATSLSRFFPNGMDAPTVNKTGLTGAYHMQFQFLSPIAKPGPTADPPAPSIFTAVQKLGLKLEAGQGPRQFVVCDRIERPTEN
jgi:uncharacterized protein (TIGR03435 family)